MNGIAKCPAPNSLSELVSGLLDRETMDQLERHVAQCPHCVRHLRKLRIEEDLLEQAVHRVSKLPPLDEESIFAGLIDTLKELPATRQLTPGAFGERSEKQRELSVLQAQSQMDFLSPAEQEDEIGRCGGYRVLRLLDSGGMGLVFVAEDPLLHRQVALKVIRPQLSISQEYRERFLREARAVASLDHEHIVSIYQCGEARGVLYLVMPLLTGESLERRLAREPQLPPSEACRIACQTARGLSVAHERGLVHRDLKPANLWLDDKSGLVKILDFGLARAVHEDQALTQAGVVTGTPHYLSPEQATAAPVGPRSDLFSLGCLLYRMCTGKVPFPGENLLDSMRSLANTEPVPPHEVVADVPRELSSYILKLLAKQPDDRPESAQHVVAAMERIEAEWFAGQSPVRTAAAQTRRGRGRVWAGVAILLVATGGAAARFFTDSDGGNGVAEQPPAADTREANNPRTPGSATPGSNGNERRRHLWQVPRKQDPMTLAAPDIPAITVTTTGDAGVGSLRWAIEQANARAGDDRIVFQVPTNDPGFVDEDAKLPGGDIEPDVFVIKPFTQLPALSDSKGSVIIDGYSQAEAVGDTNPLGPEIVIDGSRLFCSGQGLLITSDGNQVHGLNIRGFSMGQQNGRAIRIDGGCRNWISGNYLGTDATGTLAIANAGGIDVRGGGSHNVIGTNGDGANDAAEGNLISGNGFVGICIRDEGSNHNIVAGNRVGTDRTGMHAIENARSGPGAILVEGDNTGNIIGTNSDGLADAAEANLVSGNYRHGIRLGGDARTIVAGNVLDTAADGTTPLPNQGDAIYRE